MVLTVTETALLSSARFLRVKHPIGGLIRRVWIPHYLATGAAFLARLRASTRTRPRHNRRIRTCPRCDRAKTLPFRNIWNGQERMFLFPLPTRFDRCPLLLRASGRARMCASPLHYLRGGLEIDGVVDTGAQGRLYMSSGCLKKFGLECQPLEHPVLLRAFDKKETEVVSFENVPTTFNIQGNDISCSFIISTKLDCDVLIGLQWLKENQVFIDCACCIEGLCLFQVFERYG